jgi:hypothetical protein
MQVAKGRFARHLIEAFLDVRVEALSAATN